MMASRPTVTGLTVDAAGARDIDDAIWVEPKADGGYVLTASAADVASHVPQGSADDTVAAARSLNVYSAGPRSSMLGEHVTARLARLDARVLRAAVVIRAEFDASGRLEAALPSRAAIRSLAKLSYPAFDEILADSGARLRPMCEAAVGLARQLWLRRVERVGLPDWDSAFDSAGNIMPGLRPGMIGQTVVHEMMVAANAAAAGIVRAAGMPMIYRNQGARPGGPGGRYEVVCHGHSALAQTAYGQFFSAMRRYTDLVNQRALCAVIEGKPAPYGIAALARICAAANVAEQRADFMARTRTRPGGQTAAEPADGHATPEGHAGVEANATAEPSAPEGMVIERLDPFAFYRLLRTRQGFDRRTLLEFHRRMESGLLTHASAAWLLFGRDAPADGALRSGLLARLAASPGEIGRIWRIARESHRLPPYEAELARTDLGWSAAAVMGRHTGEAVSADPLRARNIALVRLAASSLLLTPPDAPAADAPVMRFADTRAREGLESLCRLMDWEPPEFRIAETFTASGRCIMRGHLEVLTDSWTYKSPMAHGSQTMAVEAATSELALAALQPYAGDILQNEACRNGIDLQVLADETERDGPVAALGAFCQRYGARQRWIWLRERPCARAFHCILEVSAGANTLRAAGLGSVRSAAMEMAAKGAAANLLGQAEIPSADARDLHPGIPDAGPGVAVQPSGYPG
jgi:hypothetical protein